MRESFQYPSMHSMLVWTLCVQIKLHLLRTVSGPSLKIVNSEGLEDFPNPPVLWRYTY